MSALVNLFARKQIAGTLTGKIPDVIKPELANAVAELEEETKAKPGTGDGGMEINTQSQPDAPHVDATVDATTETKQL